MIVLINMLLAYKILLKIDNAVFSKRAALSLSLIIVLINTLGVIIIGKEGIVTFIHIITIMWLLTIGIVDYYSGYIYSVMMIYALIPILISSIVVLYQLGIKPFLSILVVILIIYIILKITELSGGLGDGDVDILSIASFVMCTAVFLNNNGSIYTGVINSFIVIFSFFSLAGFLFSVRYIFKIGKGLKLKESCPFVPSIFMAYIIIFKFI